MNEKAKEALKELKNTVLALHRSAGKLDEIIMLIENGCTDVSIDITRAHVLDMRNHREEYNRACGFDLLKEREEEAWNNLIEALNK